MVSSISPAGSISQAPLSGHLPASGFLCSSSDFDTLQTLFPTSQGSWEAGLSCTADNLGVFFCGGKTWRRMQYCCHQALNPALCLHPASSEVWENRFMHPSFQLWETAHILRPEGDYSNRGRARTPSHCQAATLRENKLYSRSPRGPGGCQLSH